MKNFKDTLLLPKNPVDMKANLPTLEPKIIERWQKQCLYDEMRKLRKGAPIFLLHDGPPYANGEIHMGHALNKTLKDIVVRFKSLTGYDTPFVPGWDCHGLPIEHNVMKEMGASAAGMNQIEVRKRCREFAKRFIDIQRKGFIRLGCIGKWSDPYLTMDPLFEGRIIEAFRELANKGFIYRGQKPIHWCPECRTALAASTAEAEYANHVSDSVIVLFPSTEKKDSGILIWTTTPWTLPANLAVAVRPDLKYVEVEVGGKVFLLAEALLEKVASECGWNNYKIVGENLGQNLEGKEFRHPFLDRTIKVILGDFITTDQGTGVVHIAPGHGLEDYIVGLKYGLKVFAPVDEAGRFTEEAGVFPGMNVFKANKEIIKLLEEKKVLLHSQKLEHQYPHCWRCKGPVIFRATPQWFMKIDHALSNKKTLREFALESAEKVQWIPNWGKDRFVGSVRERPDWCLSRQRAWGVPIPTLICPSCGETVIDNETMEWAVELAKSGRLDEWFDETIKVSKKCPKCNEDLRRERDILDVWFDSGVSWYSAGVFDGGSRKEGEPPVADLYLEGSDQHRGWFQSSLWPSLAIRESVPYKAVLTHGFMLDGEGRAMHKSAGNVIAPDEIMSKYGADIIRLWVASENYREDLRLSLSILDQIADSYRKIRNTWRFLAANIKGLPKDFDIPIEKRPLLDQWMIAKLNKFLTEVRRSYENYAFHEVYRSVVEFSTNDLSSFYLDVIKDRLYCDSEDSLSRMSAQLTCREVLSAFLRVMAPILCFSTDEVWERAELNFKSPSVHLTDWPQAELIDENILNQMETALEDRKLILKAIEDERIAGRIKSSQMAEVEGNFKTKDLELLKLICQVAEIRSGEKLTVSVTSKEKCPRCWRHLELTEGLCERCLSTVKSLEKK
ncbi:MAG: isoleucine--tRNA ligase [Candidatus Hydrogenedentes bacterium CG07_land_8_20_14_0_80_42_17]|nr:MAG: isoleucine--tRNA ligase [Candidatus Hydrogenedentes bacterium CG07_land_8_20_14_0_80_42_17]